MFVLLFCFSFSILAQTGFSIKNKKRKDKIAFKLINNLPVIPVEINGTTLSFILDTGVKSSILFSLENADSLQVKNTTPIKLQGLGEGGSVDALKSINNEIKVGNALDSNHTLYIIFDKALNFSPRMGVPIHGILGNDFFQSFIVKINYTSKYITVYDPDQYSLDKCRNCEDVDLSFFNSKPYISLGVASENRSEKVTLLIDSGSSDVLWLFDSDYFIEVSPKNYFEDFLGLGLSGDIYGKRTRLPEVILGNFTLKNVNAAFPDEEAIDKARYFKERDGSLGGGFLSRFTVTFDYANKKVRFKKNNKFNDPFYYNMSGLTLEHEGMELVKAEKRARINSDRINTNQESQSFSINTISVATEFEFSLVPKYVVVDVRENSPAAIAGIQKGDEIASVNGKPSYMYELYQLIEMFTNDEGKKITMEIKRDDFIMKVKFILQSLL